MDRLAFRGTLMLLSAEANQPPLSRTALGSEVERLRTELAETKAALDCEAGRRRKLERAVIEAIDNERRGVAKILHNTVCQSLSGAGLLCRVALRKAEAHCPGDGAELADLGRVIGGAVTEIHDLLRWLRPPGGDEEGMPDLAAALRELGDSISRKVRCEVEAPAKLTVHDEFTATQLLQIARQAANDAMGRAGVGRITVTLSAEDQRVTLSVRDDGESPATEATRGALDGAEMMRLRASAIGAILTNRYESPLSTTQGETDGTTIVCTLPQAR
jgi:signal transduction histidine kinase